MKRMREISAYWTQEDAQFLSGHRIKVNVGFTRFYIAEDDVYFAIRDHFKSIRKERFQDIFYYEYSKEDIESADYCILRGCNCCGYPQPEIDFKYLSVSFDADKICPKCGCGRIQTGNLRVNKVSKYGFWSYSAWLDDEFFVSKEIYDEVFAPYGIQKREVIKGGKILENIFQLVIPMIDESIDLSDREPDKCPVCGEAKYTPQHFRFPFFPLHKHPLPGIYKSKEYFGYCYDAFHQIFICKEIVQKLLKSKDLRMYWLIPCRRE